MSSKSKSLQEYFRLNTIQLHKSREIKTQVIFPDSISGAIYLKTLAQAENAFTLLEMVIGECSEELQEKIYGILLSSGSIKGAVRGDLDL